jgi:hypothetical protein
LKNNVPNDQKYFDNRHIIKLERFSCFCFEFFFKEVNESQNPYQHKKHSQINVSIIALFNSKSNKEK